MSDQNTNQASGFDVFQTFQTFEMPTTSIVFEPEALSQPETVKQPEESRQEVAEAPADEPLIVDDIVEGEPAGLVEESTPEPVAEEAAAEEPAAEEPVAEVPVVEELAAEKSPAEEVPVEVEEVASEQRVVAELNVEEPVVEVEPEEFVAIERAELPVEAVEAAVEPVGPTVAESTVPEPAPEAQVVAQQNAAPPTVVKVHNGAVTVQRRPEDNPVQPASAVAEAVTPASDESQTVEIEASTESAKVEVRQSEPVVEAASQPVEVVAQAPDPQATPVSEPSAETTTPQTPKSAVATNPAPQPVVASAMASETPRAYGKADNEVNNQGAAMRQASEVNSGQPKSASTDQKPRVPGEVTFRDLPLHEDVQRAIEQSGYEKPTDIQAQIIPHVLEGRDVLAQSQTGTGKTAAFALPVLSNIDTGPRQPPQVLVLAPTRELAIQVAKSFSTYASCMPRFGVAAIYGGQDYGIQLRALRDGVQVVVGTPGRVIDHIKRGTLDLSNIKCLVLDEADEMLNMGFLEDVQFVLDQTPAGRQVALFSATLPPPIRTIAQRYLSDPTRITIKKKTMTADSIRQRALFVPPRDKVETLIRILEVEETDGVIVFTKTREATVSVAEQLSKAGLNAIALNGDMAQRVRERTIDQLKSGHLDILVATDVAARGLDVNRISHVFNYDMPQDTESYIHRVGRTGRAGRKGEAVIFLTNNQRGKLRMIERATKQPIEVVQPPTADEINAKRIERFTQQITDVTAEADLTIFKDMISKYAEESGKPLEMIAAALAHIAQQGRPFFMKDRPARKRNERDDRGGRERFERGNERSGGRSQFSDRPSRPSGGGRQLGPPEPGMDRYRIEVGWQDGVKPGNIVGAVANEGGIDGDNIGPISIHDEFSTIDLPTGMPRDVFQTLQQTRVAGKQLRLSASRGEQSSPPRRNQGYQGGKPGGFRGKSSGNFSKGRKFRK
ncbi:DEAD/DEAH box helicase [Fuerstiella marisgermanici]|uniref:ATP-dependent RNA helicase DeaD n=1 Tax=Fuerstiella marisgermanici TaxID=1891926 RepID=A0A1P8WIM0_9PLAN|nr:DEAD/DEAH box helicase [Fuerstiella marisgermanici]APZ93898.1 Cold-shock DEAD box protein A [Fuerstiella marisgermanici]